MNAPLKIVCAMNRRRIEQFIVALAVWGFIPLRLAGWLMRMLRVEVV